MIKDLGYTIAEVCKEVIGGILIFFPSYNLMEEYLNKWTAYGIKT